MSNREPGNTEPKKFRWPSLNEVYETAGLAASTEGQATLTRLVNFSRYPQLAVEYT